MPVKHLPEIGAKTGTRKPVSISDASHMQFDTEFFRYQFLVTNRTCSILGAGLWHQFSGTDFQRPFAVRVSLALTNSALKITLKLIRDFV